jgi:alcohol dehydrogenase
MAKSLQLNFPGRSHVGPGCVEALGPEAAALGSRALLVTGRHALREAGITDRLVELLEAAGLEVALFEEVPPEPGLAAVDAARRAISQQECDLVVEAGGGSAMDAGKAAAALAGEKASTADFHAGRGVERPGLPHIAVATTAGTGAETTRNAVITDPASDLKKSIRGDGLLPTVSITDAELALSCPPPVTAASGMDALVQAIESYFSAHAIPTTEALSLEAIRLSAENLAEAYRNGGDLEARAAMAEASFMAGLALGSARLGAVHGLAHPLGLCYELPHGVVCGALMPAVLQSNVRAAPDKYERLRSVLGSNPASTLETMLDRLDMPRSLGPYPSTPWEQRIIEYALKSGSAAANPTQVDASYVRAILQRVTD